MMRALIFLAIASVATLTTATPGGPHEGLVLSGPSGVVTNHEAIGPAALGLGAVGGHGGAYIGGPAGPSSFVGGPLGPSAYISGPAVSHASVIGPAAGFGGHGLGLGLGAFGGYGGLGFGGFGGLGGYGGHHGSLGLAPGVVVTNGGGTVGVGHHGVTVKGPATVPVTISGPAGKVVANGLYGVPSHGW